MPIGATKHPCSECPFRKRSMRGWLGPWPGPEALLLVAFADTGDASGHGHPGFVCHKTIRHDNVRGPHEKVCAGSLHCANKSVKRYADPHVAALQAAVDPEDAGAIMTAWEFNDHHKEI